MGRHRERTVAVDPKDYLDLFGGKSYVLTAAGAHAVGDGSIGRRSPVPAGVPAMTLGSLRVNLGEFPRAFVARAEKIGGTAVTHMYCRTLIVPYTAVGRALAQEVLATDKYGLRGVEAGCTLSIPGTEYTPREDHFPVRRRVFVGQPEYREHEQLKDVLPDMPADQLQLPITIEALEDLYRLVFTVCEREGLICKRPETYEERRAFEAATARFEADQADELAYELTQRAVALTRSAEAEQTKAHALRERARLLSPPTMMEE